MTDQATTTSPASGSTMSTPENRGAADDARGRARDVADTGKQEAGRVVDEARAHTSRLVGETGGRAREHADQQLGRAAGVIGQFGSELEDMAAHSSQPDGYLAALARDGAQSAHQLSRRLDDGGLDGVVSDITRFARQRPGTFLAASLAIGLALGRVTRNADFGRIKQEMSDGDATPTTPSGGGSVTGPGFTA